MLQKKKNQHFLQVKKSQVLPILLCGLLPIFVIEGHFLFQLEVTENKKMYIFLIQVDI